MLLEKYKHVVKEISSDKENSNDSDEECSDEKILMNKIKYNFFFRKNIKKLCFQWLRKKVLLKCKTIFLEWVFLIFQAQKVPY